ncbi:hypothetical protein BgiBS90_027177 [Biomphalaria glabrata]|nr:hypothetical protein BgiBS90_027177 [Biomphalaria glabrata]
MQVCWSSDKIKTPNLKIFHKSLSAAFSREMNMADLTLDEEFVIIYGRNGLTQMPPPPHSTQ